MKQLTDELMSALEEQELVEGTLAERLAALTAREGQLYEDTPEGREALLARMRAHMVRAETVIADVMPAMPRTGVTIRAVPDFLQSSAPSAYYSAAPANGSAPAQFEINLGDMSDWPDFTLATLVFHETIPGHHLESALTAETANLPLIRQMVWNVIQFYTGTERFEGEMFSIEDLRTLDGPDSTRRAASCRDGTSSTGECHSLTSRTITS